MDTASYIQTLKNRLEAIDEQMRQIHAKGPPYPPSAWMKAMKNQRAVVADRIDEMEKAAGARERAA